MPEPHQMEVSKPAVPYPPFSIYGGKWEQAPWIVSHLPPGQTFVMPFGGAASPLWHIKPGTYPVEVFNDIDQRLVNFFEMCREHPDDLATLVLLTPVAKLEWECFQVAASMWPETEEEWLKDAHHWVTVARQSRSGAWGRAWAGVVAHSRRGMASTNSKWLNLPEIILMAAARFSSVQVECRDALACIRQYDRPETVFYCDPPYHPDTRTPGATDVYQYEYSSDDHHRLLNLLGGIQGKFVLSGYRCDLYDKAEDLNPDWRRVDREVPCRSNINNRGGASSRPTRMESLWMNFRKPTNPIAS